MISLFFSALLTQTRRLGFLSLLSATGILLSLATADAQRFNQADAYYLEFSLNALRRPVFCNKLDSTAGVARYYGVNYDTLGRPTQITRMFFGNLDSRSLWTIMKCSYDTLPRGSVLMRRTWHDPSGFPVQIGVGYGEDVLYDSTGALLMITAIDKEGERVEQVNAVTRSFFRRMPDGNYVQEWRYANNKQYPGSEVDVWGTEFAALDREAWFRMFSTDEAGHLVEETPWSIAKKPTPFPGGERTRKYERDSCGRALSVRFLDLEGKPMTDSSGVARINYSYDAKGRLIAWQALDIHGAKKGRNDAHGAASMTRTYREFDGVLLKEAFFDAEGNAIELPPQTLEAGEENG